MKQQVSTNSKNIKTTLERKTGMSLVQKESSDESKSVISTLRNTICRQSPVFKPKSARMLT